MHQNIQYFNNNYNEPNHDYNNGPNIDYFNNINTNNIPYELRYSDSLSSVPSSIQLNQNKQQSKFPLKYIVSHAALFILINVGVIIVQIGMSLIQTVFSSVGIGYWVS